MSTTDKLKSAGIKNTRQRRAVYDILLGAGAPLTAAEIHLRAEKSGEDIWLSTVYRILELFTEKGLVIKDTSVIDGMASYEINRNEHRHYALCMGCRKKVSVPSCPFELAKESMGLEDFHITGHRLEMYGYCSDCYKTKNEKQKSGQ